MYTDSVHLHTKTPKHRNTETPKKKPKKRYEGREKMSTSTTKYLDGKKKTTVNIAENTRMV